jgi:hypothetical protein
MPQIFSIQLRDRSAANKGNRYERVLDALAAQRRFNQLLHSRLTDTGAANRRRHISHDAAPFHRA